jgi:hypothetical protein
MENPHFASLRKLIVRTFVFTLCLLGFASSIELLAIAALAIYVGFLAGVTIEVHSTLRTSLIRD